MEKKENNRNYLDLAARLKLKLKDNSCVMEVTDEGIKLFPSDSEGKLSRLGCISGVDIIKVSNFCNAHNLIFYVSLNIEHSCPELVIF